MKKELSIFARNLRYIRKSKGLKQDVFAEEITQLANDQYTRNIIASYETDRTVPREDFINSLAIYSGYGVDTIKKDDLIDKSKDLRYIVKNELNNRIRKNTQTNDDCVKCREKDDNLIIKDKIIKRLLNQIEDLEEIINQLKKKN